MKHCCRQNIIRIVVFWKLCFCLPFDYGTGSNDRLVQIRRRLCYNVITETGHKCRAYNCPVLVFNVSITYNVVHPHTHRFTAKRCKAWRKQEERNISIEIKLAYLGQDGERRIVQYYAILRIFIILIISTRIKRSDDTRWVNSELIASPVSDCIEDQWRCITVIRRFLCFKFFNESVVFRIVAKQRYLLVHHLSPLDYQLQPMQQNTDQCRDTGKPKS